jgi:mannose-1-phosphate guanylyltransferase
MQTAGAKVDGPRDGTHAASRWGVVLAGGDGVRLRPLTRVICGDERPKQFCPLMGDRTLLSETLQRAESVIGRDQLLVSLAALHAEWYANEPTLKKSQRIVQPTNKGTAPPIAHCLLSIFRRDEDATVAVLPSDHYYSDESLMARLLDSAFNTAEKHSSSVVLLGAQPSSPEVQYGWIEIGSPILPRRQLFHVLAFREKPPLAVAQRLLEQGALWNTFVMVGRVTAFLEILWTALPNLMRLLSEECPWDGAETHLRNELYQRIPSLNFSCEVLSAAAAGRLLTLRLAGLGWSDLGDPARAMAARNGWSGAGCRRSMTTARDSSGVQSGSDSLVSIAS